MTVVVIMLLVEEVVMVVKRSGGILWHCCYCLHESWLPIPVFTNANAVMLTERRQHSSFAVFHVSTIYATNCRTNKKQSRE